MGICFSWGGVVVAVGPPLDLPCLPCPPPEAVEVWHRRYLRCLQRLFEEHKGRYGVPPNQHLEFV